MRIRIQSFLVAVTVAVAMGAFAAAGCGFSGNASPPATSGADADADADADAKLTPLDEKVRVVIVNGLTERGDSGTTEYQDVRVCFGGTGAALPQTGAMPLSNYPGVARGRGVDLGAIDQVPAQGTELHVFDANIVHFKPDDTCAALLASGSGSAFHQTVTFDQPLLPGKHYLLVLTDVGGTMSLQVASLEDTYLGSAEAGTPTPVQAQVGLFSSWPKGKFSVQLQDANAPTKPMATAVSPNVVVSATAPIVVSSPTGYDALSLAFVPDVAGANPPQLVQSLTSIQYVSDPTTDPRGFFDRRQNFVFVAVGDPSDTSVLANGGRNADFTGSGLHIVAVPYD